jgi:hypothetical protein
MDNRYAKKRPMTKNPHPIFKPKYNIHELSDDIRICDFTCQPDLIIAEKKNQDHAAFARGQKPNPPKTYHFDAEKLGKIGYNTVAIFYLN